MKAQYSQPHGQLSPSHGQLDTHTFQNIQWSICHSFCGPRLSYISKAFLNQVCGFWCSLNRRIHRLTLTETISLWYECHETISDHMMYVCVYVYVCVACAGCTYCCMCMCICMSVCVCYVGECICVFKGTHECMHVYAYVCMWVEHIWYMCISMSVLKFAGIYVCMSVSVYVYLNVHMCVCMSVHMCLSMLCVFQCVCLNFQVCTCVCVCKCVCSLWVEMVCRWLHLQRVQVEALHTLQLSPHHEVLSHSGLPSQFTWMSYK